MYSPVVAGEREAEDGDKRVGGGGDEDVGDI